MQRMQIVSFVRDFLHNILTYGKLMIVCYTQKAKIYMNAVYRRGREKHNAKVRKIRFVKIQIGR